MAFAILVSGCNKNHFDSVSPSRTNLTLALRLDDQTKDGISGIFFPDAPSSGAILFDSGYFTVMCVPVNEDGTLDWTQYVSDVQHSAYSTKSSDYPRVIYCETGKTTEEWFAKDKGYGCMFFATISGGYNEGNWIGTVRYVQMVLSNPETGAFNEREIRNETIPVFPDNGYDATGNAANIVAEGGKYYMASYLSQNYSTYPQEDSSWKEYGIIDSSSSDHLVGAHSAVVQYADIADSKFLNFTDYAPAGVILRFNMKSDEGTLTFSKLEISMENTGDNLAGQAYMDFSNYQENKYSLVSARKFSSMTGTNLETAQFTRVWYLQDDGTTYAETYTCNWVDENDNPRSNNWGPETETRTRTSDVRSRSGWYRYDSEEGEYRYEPTITLTTTPTAQYYYIGILPQVNGISADSRIVFKAYDSSDQCVCAVKKKLPSGGFQGGVRYDFTLSFPHIGMESDTDWSGAGTYYQGGQITEA